jgi:hypothetical protein
MPRDQCFRLHDQQSLPPVEQAGPNHQADASGVGQPSGLDFTLSVEGQLLAQKQVFCNQRGAGTKQGRQEATEPGAHAEKGDDEMSEGR